MEQRYVVRQATDAFQAGDYKKALDLYKKAATHYGQNLFELNINYCKKLMKKHGIPEKQEAKPVSTEEQLEQTQKMLEYYFIRSQELEYQLQDK